MQNVLRRTHVVVLCCGSDFGVGLPLLASAPKEQSLTS
jgi:hypothetical protein